MGFLRRLLGGDAGGAEDATPVAGLDVRLAHLGVPAHLGEDVRVLAGEDPALERLVRQRLRPVVDRTQAGVVAGLQVAAVDDHVGPVDELPERVGRGCLTERRQVRLGVLEMGLGRIGGSGVGPLRLVDLLGHRLRGSLQQPIGRSSAERRINRSPIKITKRAIRIRLGISTVRPCP